MPFRPNNSASDPLGQLFGLYQLQQSMRADEERRKENALQLGISLAQRGADVSGLLGSIDPQYGPALQSLVGATNAQRQTSALESATNPTFANPLAQANAGYFDAGGRLVAPDERTIAERENLIRQRVRMMGGDANAENIAVESARALTAGARTDAQSVYEGEKRRHSYQLAQTGASRSAAIATQADAEQRQIRGEQRREKAANIEEFVATAATTILADPSRQPALIQEAAGIFGPDAARTIEYRLANQIEASQSKVKLDRQAYQAKIDETLGMGKTTDPFVARRAADGKAGFDPLTSHYYANQSPVTETRLSGLASIYEIQRQYEAAAELFARQTGGNAFTGTLDELSNVSGAKRNPYFSTMQILGTRYRERLKYLESGAAVNPDEFARAEKNSPDVAQLRFENGQLVRSSRAGFAAAREDLESMYLSVFSPGDRGAVREALQRSAAQRLQEVAQDPASWVNQMAEPTSHGQELLMSVREASQPAATPTAQPGTR